MRVARYDGIVQDCIISIDIDIKYGLPYCVTCSSMSTDPGYLNPPSPRTRRVGSRDLYEYWRKWNSFGKTYLICILPRYAN